MFSFSDDRFRRQFEVQLCWWHVEIPVFCWQDPIQLFWWQFLVWVTDIWCWWTRLISHQFWSCSFQWYFEVQWFCWRFQIEIILLTVFGVSEKYGQKVTNDFVANFHTTNGFISGTEIATILSFTPVEEIFIWKQYKLNKKW